MLSMSKIANLIDPPSVVKVSKAERPRFYNELEKLLIEHHTPFNDRRYVLDNHTGETRFIKFENSEQAALYVGQNIMTTQMDKWTAERMWKADTGISLWYYDMLSQYVTPYRAYAETDGLCLSNVEIAFMYFV